MSSRGTWALTGTEPAPMVFDIVFHGAAAYVAADGSKETTVISRAGFAKQVKTALLAVVAVGVLVAGAATPATGTDARGDVMAVDSDRGKSDPGLEFIPGGAVNPTPTPIAAARGTGDVVALTFDDGPNPGETERLLDILAAHEVTAVFCVIGENITASGGEEILRRIVEEGHTLCNHSTSYADMGAWSPAEVEQDLVANLAIIRDAVGDPAQKVPYFRAPNGSWGSTGEVAAALGMQPLGLGNVIFDWDGNDLSVETLTNNLRTAIQPGAVALAHDGGGDREHTIDAVETVLPEKLAEGFTFTLPQGGIPDAVWTPRR